jgi:hypothetical protein
VVTGHMTDAPGRPTPRFPESEVARVRSAVARQFRSWDMGNGDLVICGAARGGDLIAASAAFAVGTTVWCLLAQPADEFARESIAGAALEWTSEFWHVLGRAPSWDLGQIDRLTSGDAIYAATNRWMLDTAELQVGDGSGLQLLAIWDGTVGGGTGGAAEMVSVATERGAEVAVIDPRPGNVRNG